ncbi:MAG: aldehyde dehydrogenase [Saprospiraceae bacterium]|nr:aldehyde dehydrogenase [Saprospiraceae bacterium]
MNQMSLQNQTISFLERKDYCSFIDGTYLDKSNNQTIALHNPSDGEIFAQFECANSDQVDQAVLSSARAFKSDPWAKISPAQREAILHKLADSLEKELQVLAELIALENGKLIAQAQSEIKGAIATFRYYAGWCTKLDGETLDISLKQKPGKQNFAFTRREPVGVVAAIVPWNFPISIASWKLAPALAAGCTVVLKPSEQTPLSSLYMAELFVRVGLPKGVLNVVIGDGQTGAALTQHSGINKITFTGSTEVGKIIGKAAMENLTDLSLELGGKSPAIVFADANIKEAANGIALGIYRNSGQVCVAGSRAYVEASIMDTFVASLKSEVDKMKISDAFDPDAGLGPLSSEAHLNKVDSYITKSQEEGASLIFGGKRLEKDGYYIQATALAINSNNNCAATDEIFGPVLVIIPFNSTEEAINLANDTRYGLSSTVWTNDINKAMECVDRLEAGWVFVNGPARSDPHFPIGGYKQSGIGKELGKVGIYTYTKIKSVNIIY